MYAIHNLSFRTDVQERMAAEKLVAENEISPNRLFKKAKKKDDPGHKQIAKEVIPSN